MGDTADYKYMCDLLKQWGLEDYIDIFINEKVDAGCLRIIDDGDIKQLIPLAGDRARFKSNLALWKAELNGDGSKTLTFEETSQETANKGENAKHTHNSNEDTAETLQDIVSVEDNSVLKLLKTSIDGKAILNSGEKTQGLLDQTLRSRLARLIATKELTDNPTGVVPGCKLMKLAHEIAQIFPKESPTIYYIPYVSATSQQIKRNASGKLYDAVVNRRRDLRKRGVIAGSSRSSRSSSSETSSATEVTSLTILSDLSEGEPEVEEKLHWLRNCVDPWHLVETNWEATTNVRLATLQSKSGTVEEYLNLYPALKLPEGYRLLLQDFNYMYKNNKDFLYSNIILHQKNIVKVAQSKLTQLKDKDVKQAIQNCIDSISDSSSKPSSTGLQFDGPTLKIRTSASEMSVLVRYFGLLVGYYVQRDNEIWNLYILLRKIMYKLYSVQVYNDSCEQLKFLISEFNLLYMTLSKKQLTPKFHFLVHYPEMLKKFGPITQMWTMRFEAKHRVAKIAARSSASRVNITKTIALKLQLQLNYLFLKNEALSSVEYGKRKQLKKTTILELNKNFELTGENVIECSLSWVKLNGVKFTQNSVITEDLLESTCLPSFAIIRNIYIDKANEVLFSCSSLKTIDFDEHFFAYEVETTDLNVYIAYKKLIAPVTNTMTVMSDLTTFVTLRWSFD